MPSIKSLSLNLPRQWNALTTEQLEAVAGILIDESRKYTLTGQFHQTRLLVRCFFTVSGLRLTGYTGHWPEPEQPDPLAAPAAPKDEVPGSDLYYECEYADPELRRQHQTIEGRIVPIRITPAEIKALAVGVVEPSAIDSYFKRMKRYMERIAAHKVADEPTMPTPRGPLSWLLRPSTLTLFPYPTFDPWAIRKKAKASHPAQLKADATSSKADATSSKASRPAQPKPDATSSKADATSSKTHTIYTGPSELMQDWSWQQYRFASDTMSYLQQCENALIRAQKAAAQQLVAQNAHDAPDLSTEAIARVSRLNETVRQARASFLATIFTRPVEHIDHETGLKVCTPMWVSSQVEDNRADFLDLPDATFQVIALFWQGMMNHLSKMFPHVFRSSSVGDAAPSDPFALYTRSTTTLVKYAAASEEEINRTTYTVILQHMNDMAEENERIKEVTSRR